MEKCAHRASRGDAREAQEAPRDHQNGYECGADISVPSLSERIVAEALTRVTAQRALDIYGAAKRGNRNRAFLLRDFQTKLCAYVVDPKQFEKCVENARKSLGVDKPSGDACGCDGNDENNTESLLIQALKDGFRVAYENPHLCHLGAAAYSGSRREEKNAADELRCAIKSGIELRLMKTRSRDFLGESGQTPLSSSSSAAPPEKKGVEYERKEAAAVRAPEREGRRDRDEESAQAHGTEQQQDSGDDGRRIGGGSDEDSIVETGGPDVEEDDEDGEDGEDGEEEKGVDQKEGQDDGSDGSDEEDDEEDEEEEDGKEGEEGGDEENAENVEKPEDASDAEHERNDAVFDIDVRERRSLKDDGRGRKKESPRKQQRSDDGDLPRSERRGVREKKKYDDEKRGNHYGGGVESRSEAAPQAPPLSYFAKKLRTQENRAAQKDDVLESDEDKRYFHSDEKNHAFEAPDRERDRRVALPKNAAAEFDHHVPAKNRKGEESAEEEKRDDSGGRNEADDENIKYVRITSGSAHADAAASSSVSKSAAERATDAEDAREDQELADILEHLRQQRGADDHDGNDFAQPDEDVIYDHDGNGYTLTDVHNLRRLDNTRRRASDDTKKVRVSDVPSSRRPYDATPDQDFRTHKLGNKPRRGDQGASGTDRSGRADATPFTSHKKNSRLRKNDAALPGASGSTRNHKEGSTAKNALHARHASSNRPVNKIDTFF